MPARLRSGEIPCQEDVPDRPHVAKPRPDHAALLALQRGAANASVARMLAARTAAADAKVEPATATPEVEFKLDDDGDGQLENKRLHIKGEGENAELMINREPMVFEDVLKNNPQFRTPEVTSLVRKIRTAMK